MTNLSPSTFAAAVAKCASRRGATGLLT
ncbi:hypothetical protein GQ600_22670 [Phytophthora cactorum]|nr:hypothetical protein GQ600_11935 [Phytophthora cactorum]KAF1793136.1 hypothetical protein GQ600_22670 [Phytophthora cactorum]